MNHTKYIAIPFLTMLLIFLLPNAYAKNITKDNVDENARVSVFQVNTESDVAKKDQLNEISFEDTENEKEISFVVSNNSETTVQVKALIDDIVNIEEKDIEFITSSEFLLSSYDSQMIKLKIKGSGSYGLFDKIQDFKITLLVNQL